MSATLAILIILGIAAVVAIIYGKVVPHFEKFRSMKDTINRDNETYLSKSGGTSLYFPPWWNKIRDGKGFNYHLMSFDGGQNWYAIDKEKLFDEILVIGLVDHIYPGLMEYLDKMGNLSSHVREHGSLDLTDKDDIEVLTDAGFTVSQTK